MSQTTEEISQKNSSRTLIKRLVRVAISAAIICVCAPFSIPIGPVPISLATFAVYLISLILPFTDSTLAVLVYVALGAVGVPVFSGFMGGFGRIIGVTGGYIIGYIPCALITSLIARLGKEKKLSPFFDAVGMIAGTLVLYALGTAWFCIQTSNPVGSALSLCVIPFLPGDAAKMVLAALLAAALRPALRRAGVLETSQT